MLLAKLAAQLPAGKKDSLLELTTNPVEHHGVVGVYRYEAGDGFDLPVVMKRISNGKLAEIPE